MLPNHFKLIFSSGNEFCSDAILSRDFSNPNIEEYEKACLQFAREWLLQKQHFLLETSGSTSRPKSILMTRSQMEASALITIKVFKLEQKDSALLCLNPKFIAGKMMLVRAMLAKMTLYVCKPSSRPFQHFDRHLSFASLTPMQFEETLRNKDSLSCLKKCKATILGGAPISQVLLKRINRLIFPVYATYGMTETLSHIAIQRLNGANKTDYFSCLPGTEIKTDETRLSANQIGDDKIQMANNGRRD